ncbi:MAG: hypothetical protein V4479_12325 [Actinomycetota bacterium]
MELLFATLGGAILGLGMRYVLPKRETYGSLLLPAVGAVASAVIWEALTWLGWKYSGGWIWVATLIGSAVVATVVGILVGRTRAQGDVELLGRLSRA